MPLLLTSYKLLLQTHYDIDNFQQSKQYSAFQNLSWMVLCASKDNKFPGSTISVLWQIWLRQLSSQRESSATDGYVAKAARHQVNPLCCQGRILLKFHIESESQHYAWVHRLIYNDVDISLDSNLELFIIFWDFIHFILHIWKFLSVHVCVPYALDQWRPEEVVVSLGADTDVVSHDVGPGHWLRVLWKSSLCTKPLTHLSKFWSETFTMVFAFHTHRDINIHIILQQIWFVCPLL